MLNISPAHVVFAYYMCVIFFCAHGVFFFFNFTHIPNECEYVVYYSFYILNQQTKKNAIERKLRDMPFLD